MRRRFNPLISSILGSGAKGWLGEMFTEIELGFVKIFGEQDGRMLRNIYVPTSNGQTTEIDLAYITQKGIFVIESKNLSGWIFGDEKSNYWTTCLPNGDKYKFYNPIKQNQGHIKWLGAYLRPMSVPMFSLIVFSNRCTLKKISASSGVYVINREQLFHVVSNISNNSPNVLTEQQVNTLYEKLSPLTSVDTATRMQHINQVRNNRARAEYDRVCPLCGAKLVIRTARNGNNAGKQFLGCTSFPKCRYTENI